MSATGRELAQKIQGYVQAELALLRAEQECGLSPTRSDYGPYPGVLAIMATRDAAYEVMEAALDDLALERQVYGDED